MVPSWKIPVDFIQLTMLNTNLAELDVTLKGLNLALQWQSRIVHLLTNTLCIYHWLSNVLMIRAQVRTKPAIEMLV